MFIHDMGAKVVTHKSILFSSSTGSRKTWRNIKWYCSGEPIKVLNQFRDLGAHINVTNTAQSTTINARTDASTDSVNRLSRLLRTRKEKHTPHTSQIIT